MIGSVHGRGSVLAYAYICSLVECSRPQRGISSISARVQACADVGSGGFWRRRPAAAFSM